MLWPVMLEVLNSCHLSKTMKSSRHIYLPSNHPMESLIEASVICLLAVTPASHSLAYSYFIKGISLGAYGSYFINQQPLELSRR